MLGPLEPILQEVLCSAALPGQVAWRKGHSCAQSTRSLAVAGSQDLKAQAADRGRRAVWCVWLVWRARMPRDRRRPPPQGGLEAGAVPSACRRSTIRRGYRVCCAAVQACRFIFGRSVSARSPSGRTIRPHLRPKWSSVKNSERPGSQDLFAFPKYRRLPEIALLSPASLQIDPTRRGVTRGSASSR